MTWCVAASAALMVDLDLVFITVRTLPDICGLHKDYFRPHMKKVRFTL
jgi:hypothetical protein